ncbi:AbrB/MazE/SpoVT family DNA-binding domain-containing protein [Novosphingobium profundi]|uniref:AbrB/MazE/SpoVT family DNA-binding domain-containing protein n=1 Tax=Novosphingobium profundi TaxID=1774954 RepID=UPI001BDA4DEF|nr:AbrB/MazE/SpoVT family DNA-binding domain-containing protein [Novosphingobium profundi]MBT0671769.1 AbrB/MazE/SpoVT family DNA-binding domain-containing protein [Novosphingobium profundi]
MTIQVTVNEKGRMSLPKDLRDRMGLVNGGVIYLDETSDGLVIRTPAQAVARAQALARKYTGSNPESSVDAFLARRREDSGE